MHTSLQTIIIITLLAGSTHAQPTNQPAQEPDQPQKKHPHQQIHIIKDSTDSLPRMGTNQTPIAPTDPSISTPHQTGLTSGQDWMQVVNSTIGSVTRPSTLAEGSFVLSRTGRLVPVANDRLIFVPAKEQRLTGEGPMLLLPNATLERLENIWANQPVTVSGEVLTYHGRNHLLISDFALTHLSIQPTPESESKSNPSNPLPDPQPTTPTSPTLDEDPDVLDLIKQLDAQQAAPSGARMGQEFSHSQTRFSSNSSHGLQIAPPSLAPGLREGTLLIRRPARLNRAHDGSWMAVFDNDDLTSPQGIELTILPCSLLTTMENQAIRFGDSAKFVVSGRVYIHNNQGYLLPTFYQRLRTSNIKPWQ